MLTFNISCDNYKLPTDILYQIIPNSRSYIYSKHVQKYSGGNKDTIIHVGYLIKPFNTHAFAENSVIPEQLRQYRVLAKRLNAGYIIIHLPQSLIELTNFAAGMNLIINNILNNVQDQWSGTVLLETTWLTKDLLHYFKTHDNIDIKDYKSLINNYFNYILPYIIHCKNRIKILIDTAHLYALGCDSYEKYQYTCQLLGKYESSIIHLNGNVNACLTSDEHIPFIAFNSQNKLYGSFGENEYKRFLDDVFEHHSIVVAENNFEKYQDYGYDKFSEWCKNNDKQIIGAPLKHGYKLTKY